MYLAVGCINFFRILDTPAVVMSGGMMNSGSKFLERIKYYVRKLGWTVLPVRDTVLIAEAGYVFFLSFFFPFDLFSRVSFFFFFNNIITHSHNTGLVLV
jgi:hypothetical protein